MTERAGGIRAGSPKAIGFAVGRTPLPGFGEQMTARPGLPRLEGHGRVTHEARGWGEWVQAGLMASAGS